MSPTESSPLIKSNSETNNHNGYDQYPLESKTAAAGGATTFSIWKDRLVTAILAACVTVVIVVTTTSYHARTASYADATSKSTSNTQFNNVNLPLYRPECRIYTNKYEQVTIVQTSLGAPSQQYSPVECAYLPVEQSTFFTRHQIVTDVNTYAAPDAILQVNLAVPAFANRNVSILGFGGAFTEASALNFKSLSKEGQQAVMELLYGKDGLGYALGRVHMNSCDFSTRSYSFDDTDGDFLLNDFDTNVSHDDHMIAMMKEAMSMLKEHWGDALNIYASPWSPPAWMKAPTPWDDQGAEHAADMSNSAQPTCLREGVGKDSRYAQAWALYFTKFLTAYEHQGVTLFAVTVQNEPEFPAPWEACAYTEFTQSDFLLHHLGPQLRASHPDVKIFIFDHNKDHAPRWIKHVLNETNPARQYVDGTAIHWYAGGMDRLLDGAQGTPNLHRALGDLGNLGLQRDHIVLGSESCHCPTTGYAGGDLKVSWDRAERYAHSMLADLAAGSNGWVEWNLILDSIGGPNHLGNLCDATLLAVPHRALDAVDIPSTLAFEEHGNPSQFGRVVGDDRTREELNAMGMAAKYLDLGVVVQPLYYYMGHISRHVRPGSVAVKALVESSSTDQIFRRAGQTVAGGGINDLARNGIEVTVWPCEGSTRQQFHWNEETQLQVTGHDWLGLPTKSCIAKHNDMDFEGLLLDSCDVVLNLAGEFEVSLYNETTGSIRLALKNGRPNRCVIVKKLRNQGGAYGHRGGSQVALGDCDSLASEWYMHTDTEEITSSFLGDDVCMTTGWPFLQMGAFDAPTKKAVVILNEASEAANYVLRDEEHVILTGSIPAHSIQTVSLN